MLVKELIKKLEKLDKDSIITDTKGNEYNKVVGLEDCVMIYIEK